jgi:hypothetical protein
MSEFRNYVPLPCLLLKEITVKYCFLRLAGTRMRKFATTMPQSRLVAETGHVGPGCYMVKIIIFGKIVKILLITVSNQM